jgi:hypothetical protein
MQSISSRFETTPPKEQFFSPPPKSPPAIKPQTATDWRTLGFVGIFAVTFIATVYILRPPANSFDKRVATPTATTAVPAQPAPTPEVRRAELIAPPIGSAYWATMPDGHSTTVRYMGTMDSFDQLPRNPQLGDMWRIPQSGANWVWYTPAGFTRPAWVAP